MKESSVFLVDSWVSADYVFLRHFQHRHMCIYGATGNWFPYMCAIYSLLAVLSGFVFKEKVY